MEKSKKYNSKEYDFFKYKKKDIITWVTGGGILLGQHVFTFDKVNYYEFFADYPDNLTPEQKKIFDKECPELAELKDKNVVCDDSEYGDIFSDNSGLDEFEDDEDE